MAPGPWFDGEGGVGLVGAVSCVHCGIDNKWLADAASKEVLKNRSYLEDILCVCSWHYFFCLINQMSHLLTWLLLFLCLLVSKIKVGLHIFARGRHLDLPNSLLVDVIDVMQFHSQ